jgi:metal-dependent amidase/aminoacylase/carboxypeptidase family protein
LPKDAVPNHAPAFHLDEDAMAVGAEALAALALDQLARPEPAVQLDTPLEA